jgi:hypothetical protein
MGREFTRTKAFVKHECGVPSHQIRMMVAEKYTSTTIIPLPHFAHSLTHC